MITAASEGFTLVNPQNGNLAFKVFPFENGETFKSIQRLNHYSILIITGGTAKLKADFTDYDIKENTLLFFSPYQPFMLTEQCNLKGTALNFHPDFFCIHKHHHEVACDGVLFNNIYQPPLLNITADEMRNYSHLIEQMRSEMLNPAIAQYELLISYLKIFLINASRIKIDQIPDSKLSFEKDQEPFILQNLKDAIDKNYRSKHSPSDYAGLLNISVNALAKMSKIYFKKTLTDLISERIIIEAKRELYLTSKTVKEIAFELGYTDEYYFSRFFKKNTDVSPQLFREKVGFAAAGV